MSTVAIMRPAEVCRQNILAENRMSGFRRSCNLMTPEFSPGNSPREVYFSMVLPSGEVISEKKEAPTNSSLPVRRVSAALSLAKEMKPLGSEMRTADGRAVITAVVSSTAVCNFCLCRLRSAQSAPATSTVVDRTAARPKKAGDRKSSGRA